MLPETAPVTRELRVEPMTPDLVRQSLPLAQAVRSGLSVEEWTAFCTRTLDRADGETGMDCVKDEQGYLLGLMVYAVRPDLTHGRVLNVDPFIAMDLYGRDLAAKSLLVRIEELVRLLACDAVHIALDGVETQFPRRCGPHFSRFLEHGYHADGLRLCKPFKAA
jgi:hypothetical protein